MRMVQCRLAAALAVALLAISPGVPAVAGQDGSVPQQKAPKDCKKHPDQRGCEGTRY